MFAKLFPVMVEVELIKATNLVKKQNFLAVGTTTTTTTTTTTATFTGSTVLVVALLLLTTTATTPHYSRHS